MTEKKIIDMFFARNEEALAETKNEYGRYLFYIAKNILNSDEDAEECENDAYLDAWNSIPPHRPASLKCYLAALVRRTALDKYEKRCADKRGGGQCSLVFEEFEEILTNGSEDVFEDLALREALNSFLGTLKQSDRVVFVQRYYFMYPVRTIALDNRLGESAVKMKLRRTREKLALYLKKNGFDL